MTTVERISGVLCAALLATFGGPSPSAAQDAADLVLAAVGYLGVQLGWRINVALAWRARRRRRQKSRREKSAN